MSQTYHINGGINTVAAVAANIRAVHTTTLAPGGGPEREWPVVIEGTMHQGAHCMFGATVLHDWLMLEGAAPLQAPDTMHFIGVVRPEEADVPDAPVYILPYCASHESAMRGQDDDGVLISETWARAHLSIHPRFRDPAA